MANAVNKLRVNGEEVKAIKIRLSSQEQWQVLKELYYNGILIWKNANPFIFTNDITKADLKSFGTDTIVFEGFGNDFIGSYNLVENVDSEKDNLVYGQMVVEQQEE
jgi:hypothetical protein